MHPSDSSEGNKISRPLSRLKQERELRAWTQGEVAEKIGTTQVNVSRWEKGTTSPGPYYRQKLSELFGKSVEELGLILPPIEKASHSPIWNVPYRRNPFFTGRVSILDHLHSELQNNKAAALTQAQAISGLGGIGKTQIAVEYAYRYSDTYRALFWVTATSRDSLTSDFMKMAASLDVPKQLEQDQEFVLRAVKRWLSTHDRWLLILDNVDDLELLVDFLPVHSTGNVLITTRLQALGSLAQGIEVEKMGLDEGVVLLLRRARLLAAGADLEHSLEEHREQAVRIVTALDGLPLALDQAGAYIEETHCSLSHYLDLYSTSRKELLRRRGRFPFDHPDSVAITWSISFQKVGDEKLAAADLLHLLAFLDPEAIPEEIISKGAPELSAELEQVADDPLAIDAVIELLLCYSLIRRDSETKLLKIHRLVQAVLKDGIDRETQRVWAERAIRAVNRTFPDVDLETWEECERCLPHVLVCASYLEEYELAFPEAARLCNEAASYLVARARYEQAEAMLLKAQAIRQQVLEANHPDAARTLNDLGALYFDRANYKQAEPLLKEALRIRLEVLGEKHRDVAQTLHNLANLYRAQGAYSKAEPLHLQALNIRLMVLGDDTDRLVAESYYGLAKLCHSQEKFQKAEQYCEQALKIQELRLGANHPRIASTLNMLAKIYQGQHKLDQAKDLNIKALEIRESTSGAEHPHVATITNSLIEIYHAQGKYAEAKLLIEKAFNIHEQTLGLNHPYIAYSFSNMARNYFLRGDYIQAEQFYKKAQDIREQNLGCEHPHTATTYHDLAQLYAVLERFEEAKSFYLKALSIREHTFGLYHPLVANTQQQYVALLRKHVKENEADEY
jgi:tetratricopeptide (TPR) repeat protein/transcriptional regulator with XRE-family HTH domain